MKRGQPWLLGGIVFLVVVLGGAVASTQGGVRFFPGEQPIEHIESLRAYPEDVTSWTEVDLLTQRLAAKHLLVDLYAASGRGDDVFVIPPGDYRFDRMDFRLENVSDLVIHGQDVTFWFGSATGIRLTDCTNVTLRGITVDYDPVPFMQAQVLAIDHQQRTVDMRFDPSYPVPSGVGSLTQRTVRFFDSSGRWLLLYWDKVADAISLGEDTYRITRFVHNWPFDLGDHPDLLQVGDYIVFPLPTTSAMSIIGCQGIVLEGLTCYAAPGYTIFEAYGRGGNTYKGIRVVRRPGTNRLLVSARDVFHSYLMEQGPLVEDCEFAHAEDDLIVIHGFMSVVLKQRSPTELLVVAPFGRSLDVGTPLEFYAMDTGEPLGGAQVVAWQTKKDQELIDAAVRITEEVQRVYGLQIRSLSPNSLEPLIVHLDQPVSVLEYALVQSPDRCGAGAVVRNNYLHDTLARAVLIKGRDVLIEHNRIERMLACGILIEAGNYWLSLFSSDITIKDNTITDVGWLNFNQNYVLRYIGAIEVSNMFGRRSRPATYYPYKQNNGITISDNKIIRPASLGILVANTHDVQITNNVVENPFAKQLGLSSLNIAGWLGIGPRVDPEARAVAKEPFYGIVLVSTEDAVVKDNRIVSPPEVLKGVVGVGPWSENVQVQ